MTNEFFENLENENIEIPKSPEQDAAEKKLVTVIDSLPLSDKQIDLLANAIVELRAAAVTGGYNFGVELTTKYLAWENARQPGSRPLN